MVVSVKLQEHLQEYQERSPFRLPHSEFG